MDFLNEVQSSAFWVSLWQIILVNILLSADNAVVIALAARSLPPARQKAAVLWGAGAVVAMRIVLTVAALELLKWPWLKLAGALLLLWIAVRLLLPEEPGEGKIPSRASFGAAIKTILIADMVMSMDNVIAVAAAAKGRLMPLMLGLAISIPPVIFGATLLLKMMERFPSIIVFGAGVLGWVSGGMATTDPALIEWVDTRAAWLRWAAPAAGAVFVVITGKWIAAGRKKKQRKVNPA